MILQLISILIIRKWKENVTLIKRGNPVGKLKLTTQLKMLNVRITKRNFFSIKKKEKWFIHRKEELGQKNIDIMKVWNCIGFTSRKLDFLLFYLCFIPVFKKILQRECSLPLDLVRTVNCESIKW